MQKIKKIIISLLIVFIAQFTALELPTIADVGDFETYDGGSDWGGSSSWDYDSWDSGGSYYGGGYSSGSALFWIIVMIVIIVVNVSRGKSREPRNYQSTKVAPTIPSQEEIERQIKAQDPDFNGTEFLTWARDLFVKLQYAWSDRDWEIMRCFETPELYEQHSSQLQRYIQNGQINKIERVSVNWAKMFKFERGTDKEKLTILLNSKMIDYIINEKTGAVLRGDKVTNKVNTYALTFIRKTGTKTVHGETVNTMNCPNCGAPTKITSSGKCDYCGSVITTRDHGWSLSNLERYKGGF